MISLVSDSMIDNFGRRLAPFCSELPDDVAGVVIFQFNEPDNSKTVSMQYARDGMAHFSGSYSLGDLEFDAIDELVASIQDVHAGTLAIVATYRRLNDEWRIFFANGKSANYWNVDPATVRERAREVCPL